MGENGKTPAPGETEVPAIVQEFANRSRAYLTFELVEAALRASAGIPAHAAEMLKVTRGGISRFMSAHPETWDIVREVREELLDLAEGNVVKAIKAGDFHATKFFLEAQGKERGWGRQSDVKITAPITVDVRQARIQLRSLSIEHLEKMEQIFLDGIAQAREPQLLEGPTIEGSDGS